MESRILDTTCILYSTLISFDFQVNSIAIEIDSLT
jgi:hypothetical protein